MLRDDGQLKSYSSILILTIVMGWHQVSRSDEGESKKPIVNINNDCQGQLTGERWDQMVRALGRKVGESTEGRKGKKSTGCCCFCSWLQVIVPATPQAGKSSFSSILPPSKSTSYKYLPSQWHWWGVEKGCLKTEIAMAMIILGLIETGEVSTLGNASHPQSARSHLYQQHHNQAITATNGQNLPKSSPSNTTDQELSQWHRWPHKMYPQLSQ